MLTFPATADAPLPLVARQDVLATAVWVPGRNMWVLKDPLTLAEHELGEAEYLLLSLLNARATLRQLQREYQRRFAPQTIEHAELQSYLGRLHQAGLLIARGSGQAAALAERAAERRSARLRWGWTELLALRLRGIDPDPLLDWLRPLARVLFSIPVLLAAVAVALVAGLVVVSHAQQFVDRLPTLSTLLHPENWLYLALTVAVVKVLHELAHALVAKHLGAEVHELGILFLVFVPTLYCDVTDIWNLPSKWRRMAVSAAGMLMELCLASAATLVWWFTEPGLVNLLALDVMVVASVGTLLVNANPLMRYDGYYLLADLVETPNLWERSRRAWHARVAPLFIRPDGRSNREPWWLAVYGGLSSAYLLLVLVTIFCVVAITLRPLGLGVLASALGCVMLAGAVAGPARQITQTLRNPLRRRALRPVTALLVLLAVGLLGAMLWRLPIEDHVVCPARVAATEGVPVVTTLAGELERALPAGTRVAAGDVIAELRSDEMRLASERLAGEVRLARLKLQQLQALRARDAEARREVPTARAALADAERRLEENRREQQRLVLRAPRGGVVLPLRRTPQPAETVQLASWSGTPLEAHNRGAWIEAGTTMAAVGDAEQRDVLLAIDETDIELIEVGQNVRVQLAAVGAEPLPGTITDVARVGMSDRERPDGDAWLPAAPAMVTRYEARVALAATPSKLPIDSGGRAKIGVGRTTVGEWIARELRDVVRLP